jgi:hypothetical protein
MWPGGLLRAYADLRGARERWSKPTQRGSVRSGGEPGLVEGPGPYQPVPADCHHRE